MKKNEKSETKNKQKKGKKAKKTFDYGILVPIGVFVAFIVFGFIGMSQWGFEKLINTLAFSISFRISITFVCLFGIFYKRQKFLRLKSFEIIFLSATILLTWIFAFNPIVKLDFALHFLYVFVFGVLYIVFHLKNKKNNPDYDFVNINRSYSIYLYYFYTVALLIDFLKFNFENSSLLNALWMALVLAIGIAVLICLFPVKEEMSGYRRWGKILLAFGMYFISIVISFVIILSINYCFGFNEPTYTAYEVLEKEVRYNGTRSPSTHEVKIDKAGKESWIVISQEIYYSVEIGDEITLATYNGALGIKYSLPNG